MLKALTYNINTQQADRAEQLAQRMNKMASSQQNAKSAKIKEVAQEFEGMFLGQMLENIFSHIETDEMFGGGQAEDIYRSMMVEQYGKLMAKSGGIGIADHVMRQMLQTQEANV